MHCVRPSFVLENQHGIAKAKEAIAKADGFSVGFEQDATTRVRVIRKALGDEGADKKQKGRTGQVEVGDKGINGAEAVAGANEKVDIALKAGDALPGTCLQVIGIKALCACCCPLQGTHR